ncbi:MAG TPA: nuclear transport factor 2 family protein [Noviherbaspirillum sp.]|uniref:nuclear transport factor 2 family protein n=1 Tax=Noviherbaspirillum sp. TaxID=1926288 RepID=UPI002D5CC272|nr:nuclear transport factor 2 family protein [Noviherbaspirillum sp.]HYD95318.1 nuclear transport factor 2 family protein [Noviherbaspirillum sp.]
MNEQQARDIAGRFIDQLHQLEDGDKAVADRLADMFADGAELTNPVIEHNGGSRRGRDQIAAFWRQYADTFGAIHSEFFDVTTSDHSAGLFWRSSGTGPAGDPMEYDGVSLLVFDDAGKITRFQGFFDTRRLSARATH